MSEETPKYAHDCATGCVFLGRYHWQEQDHDLYVCEGVMHPTVIARFSPLGQDYMSGLETAAYLENIAPTDPLVEAMRRARRRGYLQRKGVVYPWSKET